MSHSHRKYRTPQTLPESVPSDDKTGIESSSDLGSRRNKAAVKYSNIKATSSIVIADKDKIFDPSAEKVSLRTLERILEC